MSNWYETISFSKEDEERTKSYQVEAERNLLKKSFDKEEGFLESLEMVSLVEPFSRFNTPRVVQLSQRSNQFNLRTIRYTEPDIEQIINSKDHTSFTFTLEDKFGNNGLIAVVILMADNETTLFIDSWFMSCRVLKRTMEKFILNVITATAKEKGFTFLKGEYVPTAKNGIVQDHYSMLGFRMENEFWYLNINEFIPQESFIKVKPGSTYF